MPTQTLGKENTQRASAINPMKMRTALRKNVDARLGDGTFIRKEKEIEKILPYTVNSFSDFIATAFCKTRSNTAAAVAMTTETKVAKIPIAIKPAGSSSVL